MMASCTDLNYLVLWCLKGFFGLFCKCDVFMRSLVGHALLRNMRVDEFSKSSFSLSSSTPSIHRTITTDGKRMLASSCHHRHLLITEDIHKFRLLKHSNRARTALTPIMSLHTSSPNPNQTICL